MKKLGYDLELMIARLSGNDEQARINLRAHQVRDRYKQALELFGEEIEQFDIHVSRGNYKQNHPYLIENEENGRIDIESATLDEEEIKRVLETSSVIEDEKVCKQISNCRKSRVTTSTWKRKTRLKTDLNPLRIEIRRCCGAKSC